MYVVVHGFCTIMADTHMMIVKKTLAARFVPSFSNKEGMSKRDKVERAHKNFTHSKEAKGMRTQGSGFIARLLFDRVTRPCVISLHDLVYQFLLPLLKFHHRWKRHLLLFRRVPPLILKCARDRLFR